MRRLALFPAALMLAAIATACTDTMTAPDMSDGPLHDISAKIKCHEADVEVSTEGGVRVGVGITVGDAGGIPDCRGSVTISRVLPTYP